ncbi:unnamed protein product [Toxocara canis]|uniref:BLOC-1-related complex subunit 7 n=1 Tax=Toxocara canis TaxID=6265 RepID=A0A183U3Z3_TOXCA|nr:unnamed protein product [Toxocara canis]
MNGADNVEWKPTDIVHRAWSVHVDEKLEQRWKALGANAALFAVRQCVAHKKQLEMLKNATNNTQHTVQEVSFNMRKATENLARLESNVSLLLEGAKLVPDLLEISSSDGQPSTK